MNDYLSLFFKKMGPEIGRREVPASSIEKYKNQLPDLLLEFWKANGWSGYGDGIFWTVNPAEYESIVQTWLDESGILDPDTYHVVARSAFGDLYLWQSQTGSSLSIDAIYSRYSLVAKPPLTNTQLDTKVKAFFLTRERDTDDFDDLFVSAQKTLGTLQPDEMYGFVPAVALGGPGSLNTLEKVKTLEHLTFLSQLNPLTDWGFPDLNDFDG